MRLRSWSPKHVLTSAVSTISLVVLSVFGVGPVGVLSLVGQAHAASCTYIDNSATQDEIAGNGVNNPVTIVPNGNCFYITDTGTYDGYTWHMFQNNLGHCLWSNGSTLDVGAACANDGKHPNEEFFGVNDNSQGWTMSNVTVFEEGGGSGWAPTTCSVNSQVTQEVYTTCGRWLFPSP